MDDRRKRQTSTATPAEPGDLPWWLEIFYATAARKSNRISPMPIKLQARISKNARAAMVAEGEALARAVAVGNSGNLSEAERIVGEILSKNPQHPKALQLLGVLLLGQMRPREAVAPLEKAARNSANPELETHLAVALGKAGRSDEALKWLYRAIERRPAYARAFQELGSLLHAMRRYAEAETVLKRGLEVAPTVPELSLALGAVYIDRADSAGAKVAFARVLSIVPGHPDALIGFGIALPDLNVVFRKNRSGRLFPMILKLLWMLKTRRIRRARILLLGVVPEHQGKGIDAANALAFGPPSGAVLHQPICRTIGPADRHRYSCPARGSHVRYSG
jgi:tetratricopeptide (TPR) repeat protein